MPATLALRSMAVALILERPSSEEGGVSGWREEVMGCKSFDRDSTRVGSLLIRMRKCCVVRGGRQAGVVK